MGILWWYSTTLIHHAEVLYIGMGIGGGTGAAHGIMGVVLRAHGGEGLYSI